MSQHVQESLVETATTALANKPWIGVASASGSGVVGIMDVLTPYLEFCTLLFGFCIGLITLVGVVRKNFRASKVHKINKS